MPPQLSDDDLDALADRLTDPVATQVAQQLDSGWYGQNLVLSRRQLLALGGMGLSATGLMALGVDQATAQSAAGQVGTESEPVDVFGASGEFNSVSTGTIDNNGDINILRNVIIGNNAEFALNRGGGFFEIANPTTNTGPGDSGARLWVDSDDGNFKVTFANGTTVTLATN